MKRHVLHEASSPPEADVWRMWCGAECLALDDGTLIPALDFYLEREAHLSDCTLCMMGYLSKVPPVAAVRKAVPA